MTPADIIAARRLRQSIKDEAGRLGFTLAGFTSPDPPPHLTNFEDWLANGRHGRMDYMADPGARLRRADPRRIMPTCKTVLVLATPYSNPSSARELVPVDESEITGSIAAYAWGADYHDVLPSRMRELVTSIERQVGHPVASRCYTDTGPILERDLAQRAGLGWIGKNTCIINPRRGSYFLLAEILLDLELEPDPPFATDHCGTCTRCLDACPTDCILPDRTIDSGRCISYLTIELRDEIPTELRPKLGKWVFGCDICQMVCPWNRFAEPEGDPAFKPFPGVPRPRLTDEIKLGSDGFAHRFRASPVKRAKRRGYLRNVALALGNSGRDGALAALEIAASDPDPLVRRHVEWAIQRLSGDQQSNA